MMTEQTFMLSYTYSNLYISMTVNSLSSLIYTECSPQVSLHFIVGSVS